VEVLSGRESPMSQTVKSQRVEVIESSQNYFTEVIIDAIEKRKFSTSPPVTQYLVGLLESNLVTANASFNSTLGEALLIAYQAQRPAKIELLKKLGDTSLYMSGFFGDSLRRKIIDIDYYADIGGAAYGNLANEMANEVQGQVYREFSTRFLDYVDLLTYISQNSLIQSNQDLLRLYERYVMTGSELAKQQLVEKGLLTTGDLKKVSNQ
jgi:Mor family transcriptional regulator